MLSALFFSGCILFQRGAPVSENIKNFGRVNDALLRGAQPDEAGLAGLQRLGVRTVINLRQFSDVWSDEESRAGAHGLAYVSVPLRALSAPTDTQVIQVLALIASSAAPVFIHCEHGADRTGTIIACYRQQHDGWSVERAFIEAKTYGFSIFQIGMKDYIYAFATAAIPKFNRYPNTPPRHPLPPA